MAERPPHVPGLTWVTEGTREQFALDGFHVLPFAQVRQYAEEVPGNARATIDNPARVLLQLFEQHRRVAVVDVPTSRNGDLRDLYGLVVEPAWRRDVELLIQADRPIDVVAASEMVEADFGYAWSLERLRYVTARYQREQRQGLPPMTPIEQRLYDAMRAAGLAPRVQYGVSRFRVDFAFPEVGLAVEADGRAWHDAARDARRDARLGALGWEVTRFSGSEIVRDAARCASSVSAVHQRRQADVLRSPLAEEPAAAGPSPSWWSRLRGWLRSLFKRSPGIGEHVEAGAGDEVLPETIPPWLEDLDATQRAAVRTHDGVVQVIAPAGSGKTRVLVARVQELRSRGAAANRILCCTFNKDAVQELRGRLKKQGDDEQVETRTFHGIGWKVLDQAGLLREGETRQTAYGEWRHLAREAMQATDGGVWIDAADAQNIISAYKLVDLLTPDQVRAALAEKLNPSGLELTAVKLYELHENFLESQDRFDYDDLVYRAVNVLRSDEQARRHWQRRYDHVLVDEFQDIDLAQQRLVQILAAPQDGLFCVGDEDQCIFAWRRATVERVIELDRFYPGLERIALAVNYRCPRNVVDSSRSLIEHNTRRFAKPIEAWARSTAGQISLIQAASLDAQVAEAARRAEGAERGELVVLARTTAVLRQAAVALARRGLAIDVPAGVLSRTGVNAVLIAYLRLFANLGLARPEDLVTACRVPNRYLPDDSAEGVAARLRSGKPFAEALTGADRGEQWRIARLSKAAELFDRLAQVESADEFVRIIRTEGGLDRHYAEQQQLSAHDQSSIDLLESAQERAQRLTVAEFVDVLNYETQLIETHLDAKQGIELRTIHGAKGREWPTVILVGLDEGELPHARTLKTAHDEAEALEDERRLAYVAFTRAQSELVLMCDAAHPSRFIAEAALVTDITAVDSDGVGRLRRPGELAAVTR